MTANLRSYPVYKPSGVPWLGDIPTHWEVRRIKTLFREKDERSGDGSGQLLSLTRSHGLIPQVEASNRIASIEDLSNYKVCRPGDLVMNRMQAWSGMFAVPSQDGLISPDYSVFKLVCESEVKYFERLFKTSLLVGQFIQKSRGIGSGFNRLYTADFGSIPAIVPPLPEQAAIVRYLDHADERIRRYVSSKQKLIRLLEEEKQAVIHRAVTRGLDPNVRLKPSGVEWLGDIPAHWDVASTKQCYSIQLGKMLQNRAIGSNDVEVPYLKAQHVQWFCVNTSDAPKMWASPDELQTYGIREGDLLVCEGGEGGRSGLIKHMGSGYIIQNALHRVRERGKSRNDYLQYVMSSIAATGWFDAINSKATIAHFTREKFAALRIPFPPLSEQTAIVRYLDKATADIDTAISRTRRQIELLQEYRTRLIADVVTGQLDVREAASNLPDDLDEAESTDSTLNGG